MSTKSVVFVSGMAGILAKMKAAEMAAMKKAVNEGRNETLKVLTGDRHGRTYRVPGTKRTYTASAPGEPPATVTGRMRGSIRGRVHGELGSAVGEVGTALKDAKGFSYPAHLELRMLRVWLAKGMGNARAAIKRILGSKWF